jgi:hypothetical protein
MEREPQSRGLCRVFKIRPGERRLAFLLIVEDRDPVEKAKRFQKILKYGPFL